MEKTIHVHAGLNNNAFSINFAWSLSIYAHVFSWKQRRGLGNQFYVNWLAGNQISAFEENALWTTPELNGELLVSGL